MPAHRLRAHRTVVPRPVQGRSGYARTADEALLNRLGYAQVLFRELGGFASFAVSFAAMSVLGGCLTWYAAAFAHGGPAAVTWGWLVVGGFGVLVAMALAELASAMPTAGGPYHWAAALGGPGWAWCAGWANLVGLVALTATVDYGAALLGTSLLGMWFPGLAGPGTVFAVFTAVLALHLGLNLLNVNVLALLNAACAGWHVTGILVIVTVLAVVPDHQPASFVFGATVNGSGFADGFSWLVVAIGLLMAQYTITGCTAAAHLGEETRGAARAVARAMVTAAAASVLLGFALLVAVTFAVPDVRGVLDAGPAAVVHIWTASTNAAWAELMLVIAVVAQVLCGGAVLAAASRMLFAFARDGAVPGSRACRAVSAARVPNRAVVVVGVAAWVVMAPAAVTGAAGHRAGASVAVVGLCGAFVLPLVLRIRAGGRFRPGAWSLGSHHRWVVPVAVGWLVVAGTTALLPASSPGGSGFGRALVDHAPLVAAGSLLLVGGWYLVAARRWFAGPVREVPPDPPPDARADTAGIPRQYERSARSGHS
ncbi:MAG: amino acid permease [Pseudonocardia sp.]